MSYEVKEDKAISRPAADVLAAATEVVALLGGKRPGKSPVVAGQLEADFHKSVGGLMFANRVRLVIRVVDGGAGGCIAKVEAYPIDAIGKRLVFGVLGEPARLVTRALWERLEARLGTGVA